MKKSVFINPFVDRGFKILFGQESSKELLIELINDLLEGEHHVEDLSYMDKENPSETTDGRGVIFDLLCKELGRDDFHCRTSKCPSGLFL